MRIALLTLSTVACATTADPWTREMQVSRRTVLPGGASEPTKHPAAPKMAPDMKLAALPARATSVVEVSRAAVRAVLAAGPQRFMSGILLDPFFVDRTFVGFQLTRFYDGDPRFANIDLRRGDVVLRVNQLPIGRPEEFMRAWQELRSADEIRIDYLRGAEKRVARIRIRDE